MSRGLGDVYKRQVRDIPEVLGKAVTKTHTCLTYISHPAALADNGINEVTGDTSEALSDGEGSLREGDSSSLKNIRTGVATGPRACDSTHVSPRGAEPTANQKVA